MLNKLILILITICSFSYGNECNLKAIFEVDSFNYDNKQNLTVYVKDIHSLNKQVAKKIKKCANNNYNSLTMLLTNNKYGKLYYAKND